MPESASFVEINTPYGKACISADGRLMLNSSYVALSEDGQTSVQALWAQFDSLPTQAFGFNYDAAYSKLLPIVQAAAVKQSAEAHLHGAIGEGRLVAGTVISATEDSALCEVTCQPTVTKLKLGMTRGEVENILRETSPEPAFIKRFDVYEYSSARIVDGAEMLVPGELYSYVASTLLNGLINYVKPIKAFVLNRYLPENQDAFKDKKDSEELTASLRINGTWQTVHTYSKTELMDLVKVSEPCNTKLDIFSDDVLILGETAAYFWYFWYDQDCSDCCIGRLRKKGAELPETGEWCGKTSDLEGIDRDELIAEFTAYVNTLGDQLDASGNQEPPIEWPVNKMAGWMSF